MHPWEFVFRNYSSGDLFKFYGFLAQLTLGIEKLGMRAKGTTILYYQKLLYPNQSTTLGASIA